MTDSDILPGCGRIGQVFCHPIIEPDLALLHQYEDGRCRELFRDREDFVHCIRCRARA